MKNNKVIQRIIELSRQNTFPVLARNAKMMEEVGEFSETLMHMQGYLPHKTMAEPLEGEAADVIICVLDTLAASYPQLNTVQVIEMIEAQLQKKSMKWKSVIDNANMKGNIMVTVVSTEPHPSVVRDTVCRNCGATLQYVPRDIKERIDRDYTGGTDISRFIVCPNCNTKVFIRG